MHRLSWLPFRHYILQQFPYLTLSLSPLCVLGTACLCKLAEKGIDPSKTTTKNLVLFQYFPFTVPPDGFFRFHIAWAWLSRFHPWLQFWCTNKKESKRVQANVVFNIPFQNTGNSTIGFATDLPNTLQGFGLIQAQVFEYLSSKSPSAECVKGFCFTIVKNYGR